VIRPPSAFQFALDRITAIGRAIPLGDTWGDEFRAAPFAHSRTPTFLKKQIQCSLETAHPAITENAFVPVPEKLRRDQTDIQELRSVPRHLRLGFDAEQLQQRCGIAKP